MFRESNSHFLQNELLRRVTADIQTTKRRIAGVGGEKKLQTSDDIARIGPFLRILHVFEVEMLSRLQDWAHLLKAIQASHHLTYT